MQPWSFDETRKQVERLFGREQLDLLGPCLNSVVTRQQYARIHYQETKALLETHMGAKLVEHDIFSIVLGLDDQDGETRYVLDRAGAYVTACVQSLHAVGDNLAHCVYYSLGLNLKPKALSESAISLWSVPEHLKRHALAPELSAALTEIREGGDFTYLNALCNYSKHRSLIPAHLWGDFTGQDKEPYTLRFGAFSYKNKEYGSREVWPFLHAEYDRMSIGVVKLGNILNGVLRSL